MNYLRISEGNNAQLSFNITTAAAEVVGYSEV